MKVECSRCKGHLNQAPCRWCGGEVKPAYEHYLFGADTSEKCWFCSRGGSGAPVRVQLVGPEKIEGDARTETVKFSRDQRTVFVPRCQECADVHSKATNRQYAVGTTVGGVGATVPLVAGILQGRFWFGVLWGVVAFFLWTLIVVLLMGLWPLPNGVRRLRTAQRYADVQDLLASDGWSLKMIQDDL